MLKCQGCGEPLTRYKKKWCSNKCANKGQHPTGPRKKKKTEKEMRPVAGWLVGLWANKKISTRQLAERINEVVK